ncbi:cilia- and flagella-associated protein 58-like [Stegodyphus dumicola]|uniref:cilia- and flagella-associated protein 58-like n=1 Tax=Stegodyphus dumicola TaxID=202533 RepID=UPI0015A8E8D9|nr:cilia- and flagella-associated protein 58-like [Stegodyphus dumicola]
MQVKIAELTSKLNQQTEITSAAVFDRKMFCQKYKDVEESRDQMKQKINILDNCVNELKESLYSKSEEVINWKNKWESLNFQNKKLVSKTAKEVSEHKDMEMQFKHEEYQNGLRLQLIAAKEKEIETLQRKLIYKTEECLTLRSQMQSQRAKISDLEEKIHLSEKVIQREKEAYLNLENSTKLLHLEILRLTGEKNSLTCKINDLEKLRESFTYAKQELNKERFKNSALERTIQRPTNVHRWRLLKGTDPEKYEILEKYQTLQKHLLKKSKEVQSKNNKISDMSKLINHMKNLTAQQKEFQKKYSTGIKQKKLSSEKTEKLKVLSFEINMYETYMASYQAEISNLKDMVKKLKTNEYFKKKKKLLP